MQNPATSRLEIKQITVYVPSAHRSSHRFNVPVGEAEKGWFRRAYDGLIGGDAGPAAAPAS